MWENTENTLNVKKWGDKKENHEIFNRKALAIAQNKHVVAIFIVTHSM